MRISCRGEEDVSEQPGCNGFRSHRDLTGRAGEDSNGEEAARRKHEKNAADIQTQIEVLEEMSQAEDAHWEKERERLEAALRRARG